MNKIMLILAMIVMGLSTGQGVTYAVPAGPMASSSFTTYEVNNLVGTRVRNPAGDMLGTITDFVIDSKGHVVFGILTRDVLSEYIAIPFSALSLKPEENVFVLNITPDELESAPAFSQKAAMDSRWTEDVYRYFGQQPYWTEERAIPSEIPVIQEGYKTFPFPD